MKNKKVEHKKDEHKKELISEQRSILKLDAADIDLYKVKFSYKYKVSNIEKHIFKNDVEISHIETEDIVDDILFNTEEEAKLYIDVVSGPSENYEKKSVTSLSSSGRYIIKLKDKKLVDNLDHKHPEWFMNASLKEAGVTTGFGIYGTKNYDVENFIDFMNNINKIFLGNFKEIKTYDVHTLDENCTLQEELKDLYGERNEIVFKEIERTKKYLKILSKLLK